LHRNRSVLAKLDLDLGCASRLFYRAIAGDYLLARYLVSRRVHLNPVWVIFALYVFGYLFGLVGLIVAVPAAAAIGVVVRFALREYYSSPLYARNLPR
jgi:predicted PurR-regulated permease PerM